MARDFYANAAAQNGTVNYNSVEGKVRILDTRSGTLGIYTPDGTPISFQNLRAQGMSGAAIRSYWNAQRGENMSFSELNSILYDLPGAGGDTGGEGGGGGGGGFSHPGSVGDTDLESWTACGGGGWL